MKTTATLLAILCTAGPAMAIKKTKKGNLDGDTISERNYGVLGNRNEDSFGKQNNRNIFDELSNSSIRERQVTNGLSGILIVPSRNINGLHSSTNWHPINLSREDQIKAFESYNSARLKEMAVPTRKSLTHGETEKTMIELEQKRTIVGSITGTPVEQLPRAKENEKAPVNTADMLFNQKIGNEPLSIKIKRILSNK